MSIISVARDAIFAVGLMDSAAKKVLPEDIAKLVNRHAKIAVASAWIPIGGLDIAAATANVWTMYFKINKMLGLQFSKNAMKSIASAVISNLVQNLVLSGVMAGLKYVPGVGYVAAASVMSATLYALTQTSGWIYLKALTIMARNDKDIDASVKEVMKDKDSIDEFIKNNKK